tara:strand:+ start:602 stop:841 length:240 start_codon:yes stop_codon:yes gene_type:complete
MKEEEHITKGDLTKEDYEQILKDSNQGLKQMLISAAVYRSTRDMAIEMISSFPPDKEPKDKTKEGEELPNYSGVKKNSV